VVSSLTQPHQRQRVEGPAARLGRRASGYEQRELDVLDRGQHGHEVVELEHEAHAEGAVGGAVVIRHGAERRAFDEHLALVDVVEPERQFRSVVLPHPLGPMIATISPRLTARSTPLSA
jgi:hypothetical protein